MTKAIANPRFFAATCLLFAGATIFNATVNASPTQEGLGLRIAPPAVSAPVLEVGPTIPPSPLDDEPSVASNNGENFVLCGRGTAKGKD